MEQNNIFRKKNTLKVYPKSLLLLLIVFALIYIEYKKGGSYLDEGLCVFATGLVVMNFHRTSRFDKISILFVAGFMALGLLSNLIYEIKPVGFSVGIDFITQLKPFMIFFAVRYSLTEKEKQAVTDVLSYIGRLFILIAFVCAILNIFTDIGMSFTKRYGLRNFTFIFKFDYQYTLTTFLFLGAILSSDKISDKRKRVYCALATIAVFFSLKSSGMIFSIVFVFLLFYFQRYNKLNLKIVIPLALVLLWASSYQIQAYLLASNAPRRIFIDYGFKTANDLFPLGSGFGTFGSAEAAKHYSQLYFKYGFDKLWGMSPDFGPFLSDTYWPMAMGQFGWIGFVLFVSTYFRIYMDISRSKASGVLKAFLYAMFAQFMVHAIGSATLTSSAGMIGMIAMSLYTYPDFEKENKLKRYKINVSIK